ncbi:MAG: amidohydrolase family protein [Chloroflexi bacterium]|nr:amidohydrolase family protein [Chloroflexota bacterium]
MSHSPVHGGTPKRFGVMGRLAIEAPAPELLSHWRDQPGMLGVRATFHARHQRAWLADGTADWLWAAAELAGVPLMVFVPGSVPAIGAVAERHPGLKLTIDHLALWGPPGEAAFANLGEVLALARFPNVAVKASALPCYSAQPYPFADVHGYIRQVYDAFGPRRMFWGTDWTRLPCTWREAITLFTDELTWLTPEDKEWIMGRAICDWLDWPALPAG